MKKIISCIASLAILASFPIASAFAADLEPTSEPIAVVSIDEKNADKKEIAASRMEDFNTIMAIMNASPMYTVVDAVVNDHVLVTDGRFTTIADFKNFINDTITGELRDGFINECDDCFTEYNGSLYVKTVYRSFFSFETEYGIAVLDPAMDGFSAITIGGNQLFGNGKAEFRFDDGKWKISNYEYGEWRDIMAVENYDFSSVAGIWYEDTEGSCKVLNIRTDGRFTYSYSGGNDFGTLQAVYWMNENEEKIIGLELVKNREMSFHAGFKAPEESPCNDIYLAQEGSPTHFIRREEPGRYTVEQLSDMAAKDYEEKTGIRPANTLPMINADDSVTVALYDENNNPYDAYILDPDTGTGELHSDKSPVSLPQTGNNSTVMAGTIAAAIALTAAGAFVLTRSGMLRKKKTKKNN